ncbi:MAG: hypothetical protein ABIJ31_14025, partial [Pseudomonadota bacterium]
MMNLQLKIMDSKETSMPRLDLPYLLDVMGIQTGSTDAFIRSLPFSIRDVTAGTENEFQTAVLGQQKDIDLARTIEDANYYKNMIRRTASGDTPKKRIIGLEKYLNKNRDNI